MRHTVLVIASASSPLGSGGPLVEVGLGDTLEARRSAPEPDGRATEMSMAALFETHVSMLLRRARRLGVSEESAEDVVQEVFVIASRKLASIEAGKEASFLFQVLLNGVRNHRRTLFRRREDSADFSADAAIDHRTATLTDPPAESALRKEALTFAAQILSEMDHDQRVAFILFELEEMEVPEIARLLDIPPGTVSSRLRRARETFQARANRYKRGAR